jgi:uroporphyrinogen decarboxylase
MTSRERVLTALNHREPDRVPVDLGAMRSTGMMAIAYARLKRHLGIREGRIRVFDFSQQLAEIEPLILERFQIDTVDIANTSLYPDERTWSPFTLPDGTPAEIPPDVSYRSDGEGGYLAASAKGEVWGRMPKGCLYFDLFEPPYGAPRKPVEEFTLPLYTDKQLEWLRRRAEFLNRHTEYALMGGFSGNTIEKAQRLRGTGNFMLDLAEDPEYAEALLHHLVDIHVRNLKLFLDAVGDAIQIIQFGDDLGTQNGPQISRDMYRRFIHPLHKRLYFLVRERKPHLKIFLHSCGSVEAFMDFFIDEGVDVINPVQTSAVNMEPAYLKAKYGDRIAFWGGGCDTQQILSQASPEQIREHVRERLQIFAPGGGYVFNTIHNIQANVPPENIVALFDAVQDYGTYPIR